MLTRIISILAGFRRSAETHHVCILQSFELKDDAHLLIFLNLHQHFRPYSPKRFQLVFMNLHQRAQNQTKNLKPNKSALHIWLT